MQTTINILAQLKNSIHRNLNDRQLLESFQLLNPSYPIILVGGTNGKGSTCEYLTNILLCSGLKVGTFTSPHLFEYNERIRINQQPIADEILAATIQSILNKVDNPPTIFSILHCACHLIFQQQKIDIAVIEVGIGGTNDVTNLIEPNISAITNVGLDHRDLLGPTIAAIAKQKVGIFRANIPNFFGNRDLPQVIKNYTQLNHMQLFQLGKDYDFQLMHNYWNYSSTELNITNIPLPLMPGEHQLENAALSIAIISKLKLPIQQQQFIKGIIATQLPGRFHVIQTNPDIIIDVAHNQHAITQLVTNLNHINSASKTIAVFAMRSDKEWEACISICYSSFDEWFVAPLASELTCDPKQLKDCILKFNPNTKVTLCDSINIATSMAVNNLQEKQRLVCFGSFLVAQEAYGAIKKLHH
jgi:dihydrofolate synthase/folylpolyglutamate synthase